MCSFHRQAYQAPLFTPVKCYTSLLVTITSTVKAVLSFPNGMGAVNEYFWEIYPCRGGDSLGYN